MNVHRRSTGRHRPLPLASSSYHVPFRHCVSPWKIENRTAVTAQRCSRKCRAAIMSDLYEFVHVLLVHRELHEFSKQISCPLLSLQDYSWGIAVACQTACKAAASRCYSVMFYLRLREGLEILKSYLSDRLLCNCASVGWI